MPLVLMLALTSCLPSRIAASSWSVMVPGGSPGIGSHMAAFSARGPLGMLDFSAWAMLASPAAADICHDFVIGNAAQQHVTS
jgi:hypothetical protein